MSRVQYRILYHPIDPNYRGGLSVRVIKWAQNRQKNYVRYWCGGQQITDTVETFLGHYKPVDIGDSQDLGAGKIEKRPKMAARQAVRESDRG